MKMHGHISPETQSPAAARPSSGGGWCVVFPPATGTHNPRSRETTRVAPFANLHIGSFANLHIGSFANYSLKFTFSAKERDTETGLSYFGARYYSSDLSIWLSVDPMSGKYPSLSPYVYCADNPVKLVDPNGEKVVISDEEGGTAVNAYYQELVKWGETENISISLDDDGGLSASFTGQYDDLSDDAKNFLEAVWSPNITVNITATTFDYGYNDYAFFGGTFMGATYGFIGGDEVAYSYQIVNPNDLMQMDECYQKPGRTSIHELMESYYGALEAIQECSSNRKKGIDNPYYKSSHLRAPSQSGDVVKLYSKSGKYLRNSLPSRKINPSKWTIYYLNEFQDRIFKSVPLQRP